MEQKKRDEYGNTPLHKAAMDGRFSDCKLIIDHVEEKNPVSKSNKCLYSFLRDTKMKGHLSKCRLEMFNTG